MIDGNLHPFTKVGHLRVDTLAQKILGTIKSFINDLLAAQKGRTQLCALLLSHGSNPFVKNQDGQTPFEVASQEDIRCLLRDAMIAESNDENVGTVPTMVQQEVEDSSEEKYSQLKILVESIELGKYFEILRKEEITIDILGIVSRHSKGITSEIILITFMVPNFI